MGQVGIPVAGNFPVDQWYESDEFMNSVGILTVRQNDVLEDYQFLRDRIESIIIAIEEYSSE